MLNWNDPKPKIGNGMRKIQSRFQPQGWFSGGATAAPNQYIRFNFNTDGFWDPKTLYLYVEVDCDGMPADCIYQLDNSAQSLFAQYISRVKGAELERVQEYDSLAAKLYDLNIGIGERDAKSMEGIGTNRTVYQPMFVRANNTGQALGLNAGATFGTSNAYYSSAQNRYPQTYQTSQQIPYSNACGTFKPYTGLKFYMSDSELQSNNWAFTMNLAGTFHLCELMNYIDMFNCNDVEGHECYYNSQDTSHPMLVNHGQCYLRCNDYGHTRITQSCVGTGEWWCSTTIPRNTIKTGLPCYEANSYGNFCVPLLSTLFGSVSSHGKLLPMKLFQGLEMEFLLNTYAFFIGGGAITNSNTNTPLPSKHNIGYTTAANIFSAQSGSNPATSRTGWKINKLELVVDVYYFDKTTEDALIQKVQNDGFVLDIKQWYLGPKIRYADGSSLSQTVQINNGFTSLCAIDFYFQPADYEVYPWCRKHKRLSGNVTSVQLRIGNEYFPSLPIVGHTGNIKPDNLSATAKGNYVEFFQKTMSCFGKFHGAKDNTLLNATNYTTNHVGYMPDRYAVGNINANYDVFLGSSLFFENNHVPRSLIALDLEKVDLNGHWRTGWDTTGTRPFDLIIQTDTSPVTIQEGPLYYDVGGLTNTVINSVVFPRPLYLVIWMLYDSRISWNAMEGWKSEGRI